MFFFDEKEIKKKSKQMFINKGFDELNAEIKKITANNGQICLRPMTKMDRDINFSKQRQDNFFVDFVYARMNDGRKKLCRNRFATISYDGDFPLYFKPLNSSDDELENVNVKVCENEESLKNVLKQAVNTDRFLNSLRRAISFSEEMKKNKKTSKKK